MLRKSQEIIVLVSYSFFLVLEFFTKILKEFDFEKFLQIFIIMMIDKFITCLLGINQKYENSGALRCGKPRTINYC